MDMMNTKPTNNNFLANTVFTTFMIANKKKKKQVNFLTS